MRLVQDEKDWIFQEVINDFVKLAKTEKGLNVIKKLIHFVQERVPSQLIIIQIMLENPKLFISNFYANYAIQLIIQTWKVETVKPLFSLILGKIKEYSVHKCSSNVVETMMCYSPPEIRAEYIKEICSMHDLHSKNVT